MTAHLDRLTVAAAQYSQDPLPDMAAWEAKIAQWVAEGAATGAKLLLFPEYGSIEIAHAHGPEAAADLQKTLSAIADAAPRVEAHFVRLAKRLGVHILAPSAPHRRADGRFVNRALLVTPNGRVGHQDKLVMTPFEHDWGVVAGDAVHVLDTALGRIGIAICYDSEFPLLVRSMTEAGAELILVPACTERVSGFHRVRTACQARALESTVAVVMSPTVGDAPWSPAVDHNSGAAGILVPPEHLLSSSGVVVSGELDRPGWVSGEIDFSRLRMLRTSGEMRNDADWALQPGARGLSLQSRIVDLT